MTETVRDESTWLTINDAAKELDVHPRTLRRYIRTDMIRVMRLSPQVVRLRPEDIEAFRGEYAKITTGTGTCYVPRPPVSEPVAEPEPARPAPKPQPTGPGLF